MYDGQLDAASWSRANNGFVSTWKCSESRMMSLPTICLDVLTLINALNQEFQYIVRIGWFQYFHRNETSVIRLLLYKYKNVCLSFSFLCVAAPPTSDVSFGLFF